MEAFDRDNLKELRNELRELLNDFGERKGISLRIKNISFSEAEFTTTMVGNILTSTGEVKKSKMEIIAGDQLALENGIPYGDHFIGSIYLDPVRLREVTVTGINTRSSKYNVNIEVTGGKSYRCPISTLKSWSLIPEKEVVESININEFHAWMTIDPEVTTDLDPATIDVIDRVNSFLFESDSDEDGANRFAQAVDDNQLTLAFALHGTYEEIYKFVVKRDYNGAIRKINSLKNGK